MKGSVKFWITISILTIVNLIIYTYSIDGWAGVALMFVFPWLLTETLLWLLRENYKDKKKPIPLKYRINLLYSMELIIKFFIILILYIIYEINNFFDKIL